MTTEDLLRDAIGLLVFNEHYETEHVFEHDHDGDGWNEPHTDHYRCWCGNWSIEWTQTDPACTSRPDPADALLEWAVHADPDRDLDGT